MAIRVRRREDILDAAKRANAHTFIEELPDGYDSLIGERGVKLSGGQAQRLSIARAILANPQILILDEATSNLDTESEQLIQASMRDLLAGRTTFVVAHRLSTIADADMILVLEEGGNRGAWRPRVTDGSGRVVCRDGGEATRIDDSKQLSCFDRFTSIGLTDD